MIEIIIDIIHNVLIIFKKLVINIQELGNVFILSDLHSLGLKEKSQKKINPESSSNKCRRKYSGIFFFNSQYILRQLSKLNAFEWGKYRPSILH